MDPNQQLPKDKELHKKTKKSLLVRLKTKRSTKVEPQTISITDLGHTNFQTQDNVSMSQSAHSTPIKQSRINNFRRHKSSENVITNNNFHNAQSQSKNNNSNRFSHQFNLCCSLPEGKDPSLTPNLTPKLKQKKLQQQSLPTCVNYDSLADSNFKREIAKIREIDNGYQQGTVITTTIISNSIDCITTTTTPINYVDDDEYEIHNYHHINLLSPSKPVSTSQPSSPSYKQNKSSNIFAAADINQTSSIAMSACRSRLKQKLLPPTSPTNVLTDNNNYANLSLQPQQQKHVSSPNIPQNVSFEQNDHFQISNNYNNINQLTVNHNENNKNDNNNSRNKSISYDLISGFNRTSNTTDSLAKQALVAAHVLNLIPMERARERNFLSGRLAANSLLGSTELDRILPGREIKIFVGTWNMNGQNPPKQMNDFVLPTSIEFVPDLVCIGTQESCSERFEWEVTLQETLGPTHILLHSATLGTLHLAIFIRRDLIWFCSVPEEDSLSVRPGTAFRTKGAVAISFALFGTSMLFVTSHLTAHQQKVKERVQDVKRIIHALDLPKNLNLRNKNKDVTQNFDAVFWCGDLNFRLGEPREKLLEWIETTKFPLPSHLPHGYMHTDQLKSILENGAAFKDFKEANITFPPTYKFDPGTQQFDTSSKRRAPAYTDRILFKYKTPPTGLRRSSAFSSNYNYSNYLPQVECILYDSVPSIITSDHKPVWALFKNKLRPGIDSIPLAAGLFNRDVYVEGMKRRLNNINTGSSAVCNIQ